jgi:hypothetical protein
MFYNKELYRLYSLPDIVSVTRSRRVRWACRVGGHGRCTQSVSHKIHVGGLWKDKCRFRYNINISLKEILRGLV